MALFNIWNVLKVFRKIVETNRYSNLMDNSSKDPGFGHDMGSIPTGKKNLLHFVTAF